MGLKLKRCVSYLPIIIHHGMNSIPLAGLVFGHIDPPFFDNFYHYEGRVYTKAIRPWLLRFLEISLVESVTGPHFRFTQGYSVEHNS